MIKHGLKRKKDKTYSFSCKNVTYNTEKAKEIMKHKIIAKKSRCFNCNHKSTFLKQHKEINIEPPKFSIIYKTC